MLNDIHRYAGVKLSRLKMAGEFPDIAKDQFVLGV